MTMNRLASVHTLPLWSRRFVTDYLLPRRCSSEQIDIVLVSSSGRCRARTDDLLDVSQLLYQLS